MATATASQDVVDRFEMEVTLIQNKIETQFSELYSVVRLISYINVPTSLLHYKSYTNKLHLHTESQILCLY